ncbi:hypothetical protein [Spirulina subsalsa]|uniref:hypothetical protein n=1 Tax=Spirulina subsalsa TaxID=54311 RepID=UPI0002D76FEC|nr:hypothetical protein [Spirulina subsalsa]
MNEYHPRHDADQAFKQSLEQLKEILEPKKSVKPPPPPTPKEPLSLADEALWEEAGEDLEAYFKEEDE